MPKDNACLMASTYCGSTSAFPGSSLGIRLTHSPPCLAGCPGAGGRVIFSFGEANPRLSAAVGPQLFTLHAVPAVQPVRNEP